MSSGALVAVAFGALAVAAAVRYRRRLRSFLGRNSEPLSNDQIRRIERRGRLDIDEPLDWDEIQREEERFWNERAWEEPEEW